VHRQLPDHFLWTGFYVFAALVGNAHSKAACGYVSAALVGNAHPKAATRNVSAA
jgi:hypothetical protein